MNAHGAFKVGDEIRRVKPDQHERGRIRRISEEEHGDGTYVVLRVQWRDENGGYTDHGRYTGFVYPHAIEKADV